MGPALQGGHPLVDDVAQPGVASHVGSCDTGDKRRIGKQLARFRVTQALHLDAAFSDALPPFNARLVNSMLTLSTLVGLSVAQLTQGTIVGNLGFSEIAFPKPLFHGDTLYAETEITEKRASKSRPGEGIVTFAHTGRNQHGDIVATASRKTMVRMRPEGEQ